MGILVSGWTSRAWRRAMKLAAAVAWPFNNNGWELSALVRIGQRLLRGSSLPPVLEKQEEESFADRVGTILGPHLFLPCR